MPPGLAGRLPNKEIDMNRSRSDEPGIYIRPVGWRYPDPIDPYPAPYSWRRAVFTVLIAALSIAGGVLLVLL